MNDSLLVDSLLTDSTFVDSLITTQSVQSDSINWGIILLIVGSIVLISILGFYLLAKQKSDLIKRIEFADGYRKKLIEFLESQGKDMDSYSWLVDRSVKMQRMMGELGKISYVTPFQQYKVSNQEIVINFVPQIKKEFENDLNFITPSFEQISFYANSLQESLIRFRGVLSDNLEDVDSKIWKPHQWFTLGLRQIISIPIYLLVLFGLLNNSKANSFRDSIWVKILSLLISIIGLIASVMTIIIGWENFLKIVNQFL